MENMKEDWKRKTASRLIDFLSDKFLNEVEEKISDSEQPFNSLSPKSDFDKHKQYCEALDWALENREKNDIKNIALTGSYGSGKSSILKTLKENTKVSGLRFLDISLATFKEEFSEKTDRSHTKTEQLRLVELSILQQIFYYEDHDKIPDSKFKKIRSLKPNELRKAAHIGFSIIIAIILFFFLSDFQKLIGYQFLKTFLWIETTIKILSLVVIGALGFQIMKYFLKFSQNLTLNKFNFQNLEIEVKDSLNKSILNDHLDEILYFFEVAPYNVVLIEDLDRFKQTEIFTKLREINLLINTSKSINRSVVFVYAVRDEIFKKRDRTKFFDFIVPVIPVIDYSNSKERLKVVLGDFGYNISDNLVSQVAFFIDDMRLLYNIVNEFHIYYQKFNNPQFADKLFSLIVYKNLHPDDFGNLSRPKGDLYNNLVNKKKEWTSKVISEFELEKGNIIIKLEQLEIDLPKNITDLRKLYIFQFLQSLPNVQQFRYFRVGSQNFTLDTIFDGDNFELFVEGSCSFHSNYGTQAFPKQFSEIEKTVDPNMTYSTKKDLILSKINNKGDKLRLELKNIESKILTARKSKIANLLNSEGMKIECNDEGRRQIIQLMLKNGYIAEDYLEYISYFYEGSITEKDRWFLMNIQNEVNSEFDYSLNNVSNVVGQLTQADFQGETVYNISIVNELLRTKNYPTKTKLLFDQLANNKSRSNEFLLYYIENGSELENFIKEIGESFRGIWDLLETNLKISNDDKFKYMGYLLNYAEISDLVVISSQSSLKDSIEANLNVINTISHNERLKQVLNQLGVKFGVIKRSEISEESFISIESGNHYKININNVSEILRFYNQFDKKSFENSNYSSLFDTDLQNLRDYIDDNIKVYLKEVYFKLENNNKERQTEFLFLINDKSIPLKMKQDILLKLETLVLDISEVDGQEDLKKWIIENNKLVASWENIIYYFNQNESKFNDEIIAFLNIQNNVITLSKDSRGPSGEDNFSFRKEFILNTKLKDEYYKDYLSSFPKTWTDLDFEHLNLKKVQLLLEKNRINYSIDNFKKLRLHFPSVIKIFVKNKISNILTDFGEIDITENELLVILRYREISNNDHFKLIRAFDEKNVIQETDLLNEIGIYLAESASYDLSLPNKKRILLNSILKTEDKLLIYNNSASKFDSLFTTDFLKSLGGKYENLTKSYKHPSFDRTEIKESFFANLKNLNLISKIIPKGGKIKVTTFRS